MKLLLSILFLVPLIYYLPFSTSKMALRPGGITVLTRSITPEVSSLADSVRPEAEERIRALGGDTETWEPESYRSQIVAGMNYFVKVSCVLCSCLLAVPTTAFIQGPDESSAPGTLPRPPPYPQTTWRKSGAVKRGQVDPGNGRRGVFRAGRLCLARYRRETDDGFVYFSCSSTLSELLLTRLNSRRAHTDAFGTNPARRQTRGRVEGGYRGPSKWWRGVWRVGGGRV